MKVNRDRSLAILFLIGIFLIPTGPATSQQRLEGDIPFTFHQQIFGQPFLSFSSHAYPGEKVQTSGKNSIPLKSIKKGLLFSFLVPGSGEFYAHSWVKGFLFLGIEVGSWAAYSSYHSKGKDLETQYLAFADAHWDKGKWEQWWNSLSEADRAVYAHHQLPDSKTQQYYEMIGKYQKFNAGWDDVNWVPGLVETDTSQNSLYYMDLRSKSNTNLKHATAFTAVALANHFLSAIDAAWSVNRRNKKITSSLKINYTLRNNQAQWVTTLSVNW